MKKRPIYPIVVLSLTLLLIIAALVVTFVGAFGGGPEDPLFKTGLVSLAIVPIIGWAMVYFYNRVHKDENEVAAMMKKRGDTAKTLGEETFAEETAAGEAAAEEGSGEE